MIPSVFNTRKNDIYTIEFRLHSATTSYKKIKNWLLICMALVDVVENHKQFLFKKFLTSNISLNDIIYQVYGNKGVKLINYIKERKEKFEKNIVEQNEFDDNEELDQISFKNL
jgi:TPP-dependent 2-oxoacid decarboxylase